MPQTSTMVLLRYFGLKPQQTRRVFMQEVRELTQVEQTELASLAAKELGIEEEDCVFDASLAAA